MSRNNKESIPSSNSDDVDKNRKTFEIKRDRDDGTICLKFGKISISTINRELHEKAFDERAISDEEIDDRVKPFVKLLTPESAHGIIKALDKSDFKDDLLNGCNVIVEELTTILGLKEKPPFELKPKRNDGVKGTHCCETDLVRMFGNKATKDIIETVAHEVWHAYQTQIENYGDESDPNGDWQSLYKYNNKHYKDSEKGYKEYYNQYIEREARAFASAFAEKVIKMTQKPRTKTYVSKLDF